MSLELIYTSAPKGLKPASSGFCTVAMTQGMPPQLVDRLEALSGYRQIFAPQDPHAALNPAVCSHLRISVVGRTFHVLSRVCAAGLDYSQRTNKFAHHVALDANELPAAGPAWLLAMPGFMQTAWDQTVRPLPPRARPPNGSIAPAVCHRWQQVTGDAGWGGAIVDAAQKNPKALVTLIFKPGQDPLALLAESLALMPPEQRWQATFSTYYTKLPPGVECRWRCVVEGSPEAKVAAGLVVNLCRPLGVPPAGEYVAAARTGQPPLIVKKPPPRLVSAEAPNDLELADLLGEPRSSAAPIIARPISEPADWPGTLQPMPPLLPQDAMGDHGGVTLRPRRFRQKEAAKWPYIAGILSVALIMVAGGYATYVALTGGKGDARVAANPPSPSHGTAPAPPPAGKPDTKPPSNAGKSSNGQQPTPPATAKHHAGPPQTGPRSYLSEPAQPTANSPPPPARTVPPAKPTPPDGNPPTQPAKPATKPKPPPPAPDPFADFRGKPPVGIPEFRSWSPLGGRSPSPSAATLGIVSGPTEGVGIKLIGSTELKAGTQFRLRPPTLQDRKYWQCLYDDSKPAALFSLSDHGSLEFQWNGQIPPSDAQKVNLLCNQLLQITAPGAVDAVVPLRSPNYHPPLIFGALATDPSTPTLLDASLAARFLPDGAEIHLVLRAPRKGSPIKFEPGTKHTTISADCGSGPDENLKLKLVIEVELKRVDKPKPDADPLRIVAHYHGVELDPADWKDLSIVKASPSMLISKQVSKHVENLQAAKTQKEKDRKNAKGKAADDLDKEIPALGKKIHAARTLLNAMQYLSTTGVAFEVYYEADVGSGKTHKVDVVVSDDGEVSRANSKTVATGRAGTEGKP